MYVYLRRRFNCSTVFVVVGVMFMMMVVMVVVVVMVFMVVIMLVVMIFMTFRIDNWLLIHLFYFGCFREASGGCSFLFFKRK